MLSEAEKAEIEAELAMAENRQAVISEALKIVQKHRGWASDEAVADVAEILDMTATEVDSIATFYSGIYRRAVGRHVICLCDSVSCWIMGYHPIYAHLKQRLNVDFGQTTADNRFTLLPCACLGVCEQAPAMMVDDDVHGNLTPERCDEILERYL